MSLLVENMTIRFGGLTAVSGISLEVRPGEILGIIGPNGAGKTTLLNGISGFTDLVSGRVRVDGQDMEGLPPDQRAKRGLVRSFQATRVFDSLTVLEHLAVVPHADPADGDVREILEMLRLTPYLPHRPKDLPYGVKRNLGLALALLMRPRFLLIDEPSSGLSADESSEISKALASSAARNIGICVIDHDMRFLRRLARRMLVLNSGEMVASGDTDDVLASDSVRRVYLGGAVV
ncbi:ATP-binding cassette domain-containing protein [Variovorax paradoxus]|nr:ATP-binding cassette domain-containing protein [Variovorax paradoxus]MBT2301959.1 ATP-binding cassette domain-containing protein [Variovorax paradoxus]